MVVCTSMREGGWCLTEPIGMFGVQPLATVVNERADVPRNGAMENGWAHRGGPTHT